MKSFVAFVLLALPGLVFARDTDNPDESFFENAAQAGIAEVEAGQLALQKGSSQSIKDFAAMMVKDHTAANNKLKTIAQSKNIKLPTEPSLKHKAKRKMLEMKSGADFDKQYIEDQIKDHEDTIGLLRKEIANGKDAEARAFASETLPTVEAHLSKVRKLATSAPAVGTDQYR